MRNEVDVNIRNAEFQEFQKIFLENYLKKYFYIFVHF